MDGFEGLLKECKTIKSRRYENGKREDSTRPETYDQIPGPA
jgi:hypothetical protein